jgi:lipopolysaccharide heptosyltransferase II
MPLVMQTRVILNLPAEDSIQRILIIKWSAMGDIVIASALFEDIYHSFPGREIHLNTLPPWQKLFEGDRRFQQVFALDLRKRKESLRNSRKWLRHVGKMRYDLVIDLQSNDRSRILLSLLWLGGRQIPYRIGNNYQFPYNVASTILPPPPHAFDRMRAALHAGGIPTVTQRPMLHIPAKNREQARQLMHAHGLVAGDYGIFFPGCQSAGYLKRWGTERYAALARQLHSAGLDKIVLIGAKDEIEECQKIERICGSWVVNLCGQTEIQDIVPLCEGARLMVGNDTGTAHVAASVDRPMVVICGPTDPRRVKPIGNNVVALQADLPCINCYRKTCSHHSCMAMITPNRVIEHLRQARATIP